MLKKIAGELKKLEYTDWEVEILQTEKDSKIKEFLTTVFNPLASISADKKTPDQLMIIYGQIFSRTFRITLPLSKGGTLPIFTEIELNVKFDDYAEFKKTFTGRKWVLKSGDKARAKQLKKLKFPAVDWKHNRMDTKFEVNITHVISPLEDNQSKCSWCVYAGYQRRLTFRTPPVSKYLGFADKLERLLQTWQ